MEKIYNKDSKLDFGMYKGYDLGIVYVFDPSYIDWCINKIEGFHISDLNELREYGIINEKLDWHIRLIGEPGLIAGIDAFDTFEALIKNIKPGDIKYEFSKETIDKNEENANSSKYQKRKADNHEDGHGYEKYGGYNGYDDDTIDNAFEGDPMNTWNVD